MMTQRQALDWILNQRHLEKKRLLSPYKKHRCEKIKGWRWGGLVGQDLLKDHPLFEKVHPTLNKDVDFNTLSLGSSKEIWWICYKNQDHIFDMPVSAVIRYGKNCCPLCAGKRADKTTCLATTHPHDAKEWHPTLNGTLTPYDVIAGSRKKVWWKCSAKGHEWDASVCDKTNRNGSKTESRCPYCAGQKVCKDTCLATTHPELAKEWHPTKNGDLTPFAVSHGQQHKKTWWLCPKGHEYDIPIAERTGRDYGCPYCSNHRVCKDNCLTTLNPAVAKLWHPTKNEDLTPNDIVASSPTKVWWQCENGHEHYEAPLYKCKSPRCPTCELKEKCLSNKFPEVALRFHPIKNGDVKPADIFYSSSTKYAWTCGNGIAEHYFYDTPNRMTTRKVICPVCRGQRKNGT